MNAKQYFVLVSTLILTACATQQAPSATVSREGDTVRIEGIISTETAKQFQSLLQGPAPRRVQITSGGGDVVSAIEIATSIFDQGMDVEIQGGCFSSCANYIFPAGRHKIIDAQGIVGWHGNAEHLLWLDQQGQDSLPFFGRSLFLDIVRREREFFAHIRVNGFVCWFGKIEPFNIENLYFLRPEDMEHFGIRDVQVRSDYASTDVSQVLAYGKAQLRLLEIDWSRFEAAAPELSLH